MVGWLRPNETGHTHSHTTRTNVQPTNEHTNEQNGQRRNDRFTLEDAVAALTILCVNVLGLWVRVRVRVRFRVRVRVTLACTILVLLL